MDFGGTPPPLHGRSATVKLEKIHPQGLEMVVLQILGILILQVYPEYWEYSILGLHVT